VSWARALVAVSGVILGFASALASAAPDDLRDPDAEYDPFAGVEQSGRIPAVVRPADLPNPERWRYIPEGRIKPGNLLERFLVSSVIAPFFFQDEDTGTGFGLAVTDIDFRHQRRREFAGIFGSYSTRGQQAYAFIWQRWLHHREREGGGVFQEERSRVRASLRYENTLTRRFFGFGPDSKEKFDPLTGTGETSYRDRVASLDFEIDHAWPEPGDDLVLRGGLRVDVHRLGSGEVGGAGQTKVRIPMLFARARRQELAWMFWGVRWDTRDSQANPYRGWLLAADADALLVQDHGGVGARYQLQAQRVWVVPGLFHSGGTRDEEHPPTDTFVGHLRSVFAQGDLPFFELPTLGGGHFLRGFIQDRFRADVSWVGAAEYRFWLLPRGFPIPFTKAVRVERVGLAPFYEIGSVAEDVADVFHSRVHQSYGIGFRISLERQAPFRVDLGFSKDGMTVTAGFGLPF